MAPETQLDPPDPDGADCVACGRCCRHGPRTVHLVEADEERLGADLLATYTERVGSAGFRFLLTEDDHCAALDVSVPGVHPCRIYPVRPADCRDVAPGSPCCLASRRAGRLVNVPRCDRTGAG
jgi:Fe-S-cluster containining protein